MSKLKLFGSIFDQMMLLKQLATIPGTLFLLPLGESSIHLPPVVPSNTIHTITLYQGRKSALS